MHGYMQSTKNGAMGVICIHALYYERLLFMNIYAWLYVEYQELGYMCYCIHTLYYETPVSRLYTSYRERRYGRQYTHCTMKGVSS